VLYNVMYNQLVSASLYMVLWQQILYVAQYVHFLFIF